MAYSKDQITTIHQNATGVQYSRYVTYDGEIFEGQSNGKLLLVQPVAIKTTKELGEINTELNNINTTLSIIENTILELDSKKEDTTEVDKKLTTLACKLIGVNMLFG